MIIDANDLPSEGMGSSQQLISNIIGKYGAEASLDVIMRNMPQIARQLGAKRPAILKNHTAACNVPQRVPPPPPQTALQNQPSPSATETKIEMPDTPSGLHTPPAKMFNGADAVPKIPMTEDELAEFNKKAAEIPRPPMPITSPKNTDDSYAPFMLSPQRPMTGPHMQQRHQQFVRPSYFKDGLGNEYKIVGNDLYVLGWQDAKVKVRMVNAETGKEVPSKGRKFQIYGWHLVEKMSNADSPSEADDVSEFERSVVVEEAVKATVAAPKVDRTAVLKSDDAPMACEDSVMADGASVHDVVDGDDATDGDGFKMASNDGRSEAAAEGDGIKTETVADSNSETDTDGNIDVGAEVPDPPKMRKRAVPQNRRLI